MLSAEKRKRLFAIYHDTKNPASFSGVNVLYNEANKQGLNVSRKDVKNFLSSVDIYGIFRTQRKRFLRSKVVTIGLDD